MQVEAYLEHLSLAARRAGFHSRIFAKIGKYELPVLQREGPEAAPHVYLSAGVHGDEPAGTMALLDLLQKKAFPESLSFTLLPMLNPSGMEAGTRENAEGIDLNRDYGRTARSEEVRRHKKWMEGKRFDLALCLHEDVDASGSYLYELRPLDLPSWAPWILSAMEPYTGIDPSEEIDGMPAANGLMAPPPINLLAERPDLPEALLLFHHHTPRCYTFETPASQNIAPRIEAQKAAILRSLDCLLKSG